MPQSTKNFLGTLATQILSWGVAFLVNIFVPGYLTPKQLASLALVTSFATGMSALLGMGINQLLVREIAREPQRLSQLFWAAIGLRLPLTAVAVGGGVLLALILDYDPFLVRLIAASLGLLVISQTNTLANASLQGLDNFARGNTALLMERVTSALVQMLLVWTKQPLWTFVILPSMGAILGLVYNLAALLPHLKATRHNSPELASAETVRFLFKAGLPLVVGYLLFAIWDPCIQILLSKMAHPDAGGWYALTRRLVGSALFIPVALANITLPILSRKYQEGNTPFCDMVRQNLRITLLCVAPITAIFVFASQPVLLLLHYLPKYYGALPVFRILGVVLLLWFLSQSAGSALIASDRQKFLAKFTFVAALLLPVSASASIYLTHRFWNNGAIGAVVSDIFIEVFLLVNYFRMLPHDSQAFLSLGFIARILAASTPQALIFTSIHRVDQLWAIPLGILSYLVACYLLRCITADEIQRFVVPIRNRYQQMRAIRPVSR